MTFSVVKRQKRLWIDRWDGTPIYTPPNFVRLPNREPLIALALHFTLTCSRDIDAIAAFEDKYSARKSPRHPHQHRGGADYRHQCCARVDAQITQIVSADGQGLGPYHGSAV
jgi:hypothetical protein